MLVWARSKDENFPHKLRQSLCKNARQQNKNCFPKILHIINHWLLYQKLSPLGHNLLQMHVVTHRRHNTAMNQRYLYLWMYRTLQTILSKSKNTRLVMSHPVQTALRFIWFANTPSPTPNKLCVTITHTFSKLLHKTL